MGVHESMVVPPSLSTALLQQKTTLFALKTLLFETPICPRRRWDTFVTATPLRPEQMGSLCEWFWIQMQTSYFSTYCDPHWLKPGYCNWILLLAPFTVPAFVTPLPAEQQQAVSVFPTVKIPEQTAFAAQTWRLWQQLFRASHGWFALTNCKLFLLHLAPATLWKWWCLITSCNDMASRDDAVSSHLQVFCGLFLFCFF